MDLDVPSKLHALTDGRQIDRNDVTHDKDQKTSSGTTTYPTTHKRHDVACPLASAAKTA